MTAATDRNAAFHKAQRHSSIVCSNTKRLIFGQKLAAKVERERIRNSEALRSGCKEGAVGAIRSTEATAQAASFVGILADAFAQEFRRADVGLRHDLLATQDVGDDHPNLALTRNHRYVMDGERSSIDQLLCRADVIDEDIDGRRLSSLPAERWQNKGNESGLGRKLAGPTNTTVMYLTGPRRGCAHRISEG